MFEISSRSLVHPERPDTHLHCGTLSAARLTLSEMAADAVADGVEVTCTFNKEDDSALLICHDLCAVTLRRLERK